MLGVVVDPCSLDSLIDGSSCIDHLSPKEKLAAEVFYTCAGLDPCLGQDCSLDTLQADAACLRQLSKEKLESIAVYADFVAAIAAGADLDGTMDELQEGIKCLRELDEVELMAILELLRCRMRNCISEPIT